MKLVLLSEHDRAVAIIHNNRLERDAKIDEMKGLKETADEAKATSAAIEQAELDSLASREKARKDYNTSLQKSNDLLALSYAISAEISLGVMPKALEIQSAYTLKLQEAEQVLKNYPDILATVKTALGEAYNTDLQNLWITKMHEWSDVVGNEMVESVNMLQNAFNTLYDNQIIKADKAAQKQLENVEKGSKEEEAILSDLADKKKKIKEKEWKANKAASITDSIIATALAISRALPNIPLAVTVGAIGAAQTGIIAAKQMPSFATGTPSGGYIVPPGYEDDSFPVQAKSGERVTVERDSGEEGMIAQIALVIDGDTLGSVTTRLIRDRKVEIRMEDVA